MAARTNSSWAALRYPSPRPASLASELPVGGIGRKPLGLETEALLGSLNHCFCRADLGLANGPRCFNVNDDSELHVDEVIVGVREEAPCGRRSTAPRERTARRTSGQRRCRRPMPYHPGSPDTPSPRAWILLDRDSYANPDLRSSAACWHRPQSGSHRLQNPSPPTRPAAMHVSTIRSNTRRITSPSRKRSYNGRGHDNVLSHATRAFEGSLPYDPEQREKIPLLA
jgi:hypothetical protein